MKHFLVDNFNAIVWLGIHAVMPEVDQRQLKLPVSLKILKQFFFKKSCQL